MDIDGRLQSISEAKRESPQRPDEGLAPAFVYAIGIAIGAGCAALMFRSWGIVFLLLFSVALMANVVLRIHALGTLLIIIQAALLTGQYQNLTRQAGVRDVLLTAGVILLLLSIARLLLIDPDRSPLARVSAYSARFRRRSTDSSTRPFQRKALEFCVAERATAILRIVVAVAGAAFLLRSVPINPRSLDEAMLIPSALRMISLGVLLLAIYIVTDFLLDVITWRRIAPRESRLFLRSVVTSWCDAVLRAVAFQDQKQKRRPRR